MKLLLCFAFFGLLAAVTATIITGPVGYGYGYSTLGNYGLSGGYYGGLSRLSYGYPSYNVRSYGYGVPTYGYGLGYGLGSYRGYW